MDAAAQYALAYALTTTAGIRAIMPLAAVAIAAHLGILHPPAAFAWLGHASVMWALCAIAGVELLADKVPLLDHGLHFLQIALKPAAAAIIVGGAVHPQNHDTLVLLMVAGALNALGVHSAVAATRAVSTVGTAGIANPALSAAEDAGSIVTLLVGFFAPFLAAALALLLTILLVVLARRVYASLAGARRRARRSV
ncbi:MAG: hypothetical protein DLM50_01085 [Candidatus Meridianibacter frigidus]|nr:MAG: hypothetical protein DLM50_01085 [Candidatus Eremiobacteraeota bacterium]